MLQFIRDRAKGPFVYILFGALIISLAGIGASSFMQETIDPDRIGTLNGDSISRTAVNRYIDQLNQMNQMMNVQNVDETQIKQDALNQVINQQLIQQSVAQLKLQAGDAELINAITNNADFHEQGRFSQDTYRTILRQSRLTETMYEAQMRSDLAANHLIKAMSSGTSGTKAFAELARITKEKRDIHVIEFPIAPYLVKAQITDDEIKSYFEAHADQYIRPEQVKLNYVELNQANLTATITDQELAAAYEKNKDSYGTPEKREADQIFFSLDVGADASAALKDANELYQQLKAGKNFEEIKKLAAALKSKPEVGSLGELSRGMIGDNTIDKALFAIANTGEVAEPFQSSFGVHLIHLNKLTAAVTQSLDEVKDGLRTSLMNQKIQQQYNEQISEFDQLTEKNSDNLNAWQETMKLEIKSTDWIGLTTPTGILANPEAITAINSDAVKLQGKNSPAIALSDTHAVIFRIAEQEAARPLTLAEASDSITETLRLQKGTAQAKSEAEQLLKQVTGINDLTALEPAAKKANAQYRTLNAVTADSVNESPTIVQKAFELVRPATDQLTYGLAEQGASISIVAISKVVDGSAKDFGDQLQAQQKTVAQQYAIAELTAYLKYLKDKATIQITDSSFQVQ